MKKILRIIGWVSLALILCGLCFFGWVMHNFDEGFKADFWSTDSQPDAAMLSKFVEWGYPSTISRVVRHGDSCRFNGDGEDLTIYCFPVSEVPQMKLMFGSQAVWVHGLPSDGRWRSYLKENGPKDLSIDDASDGTDYIHMRDGSGSQGCTIIDIKRGISYEYRLQT